MNEYELTKRMPLNQEVRYIEKLKDIDCKTKSKIKTTIYMSKFGKLNKNEVIEKLKSHKRERTSFVINNDTFKFIKELEKETGIQITLSTYVKTLIDVIYEYEDDFNLFLKKEKSQCD